jgi:hypothetical protein
LEYEISHKSYIKIAFAILAFCISGGCKCRSEAAKGEVTGGVESGETRDKNRGKA